MKPARNRPGADFPHGAFQAAGVDEIAFLHGPLKQDDQPADDVAGDVLKTEADAGAHDAGEERERPKPDPDEVERQGETGEEDQIADDDPHRVPEAEVPIEALGIRSPAADDPPNACRGASVNGVQGAGGGGAARAFVVWLVAACACSPSTSVGASGRAVPTAALSARAVAPPERPADPGDERPAGVRQTAPAMAPRLGPDLPGTPEPSAPSPRDADDLLARCSGDREAVRWLQQRVQRSCRPYRQLPPDVRDQRALLQELAAQGRIVWGRERILAALQRFIDATTADTHLLLGVFHNNPGQYAYANELLFGPPAAGLRGVTHVALEILGQGGPAPQGAWDFVLRHRARCAEACTGELDGFRSGDLQPFLDFHRQTGSAGALAVLAHFARNALKKQYPQQIVDELLTTVRLAHGQQTPWQLLAADVARSVDRQLSARYSAKLAIYDLREALAIAHVAARRDPSRRDVTLYVWGADHVDKYGLPKFLPPQDVVLSIGLSGGGAQNPKIQLEQAIRDLGWGARPFLAVFTGPGQLPYRPFDWLVHLPFDPGPAPPPTRDALPYTVYHDRLPLCPSERNGTGGPLP